MTPVPLTRHQPPDIAFQACSQKALVRLATFSLPLTRQDPARLASPLECRVGDLVSIFDAASPASFLE